MKTGLIVLGTLLIPAVVAAQPGDPTAPPPAAQATVVVTPPAPPQPPPPPVETTVVAPLPPPVVTTTPEYEVVEDSYNAPIFVTGALVFGATYGASVITAASDDSRGNNRLYVPLLGPWLALNDRGSCDITRSSCDHETTAKVLLVADGVFQAAGVIAMIDGIFQPSTHRVYTRSTKVDTKIRVVPSSTGQGPGVSMFGRF